MILNALNTLLILANQVPDFSVSPLVNAAYQLKVLNVLVEQFGYKPTHPCVTVMFMTILIPLILKSHLCRNADLNADKKLGSDTDSIVSYLQ